ncbi:MAG: class I SAM-dependent methyltransferase [Myxococcaceae bacterium]
MSQSDPSESYRRDRVAPAVRFDDVETTVSHLFRRSHPALANRSYGEALYDGLAKRGLLTTEFTELGGGTGFVAKAISSKVRRYTFVDLSRPLLRLQRERVPAARAVCASAERLPFAARSMQGLFLANEVIADLRVAPTQSSEAIKLVTRFELDATDSKLLNVGAIHLVQELARVLAPGAAACLTEFGGDFAPAPVRLYGPLGKGDHVEHSIHWGQLETVAKALGLQTERVPLADLLEVDRRMRVASYVDVLRLRHLVPRVPILAFPKEELEARHPLLTRFFRFEFPEIGSPRFPDPQASGGFCQLFHALLLRRPS